MKPQQLKLLLLPSSLIIRKTGITNIEEVKYINWTHIYTLN